jgi:LDH2 family malate/lactate/ureidoglycolate dehydrogenase
MAGILSGAALTHDIDSWNKKPGHCGNTGHMFMAMDISKMMAVEDYINSVETMIDQFKAAKKAEGVQEIFFPGELEHRRAAKAGDMVNLLPSTWEKLLLAAQYAGVEL